MSGAFICDVFSFRCGVVADYPIAQGPGPPQRPQVPGELDEVDFADEELTANTLSVRAVFVEPQLGHSIF
jgi:hypothetical protein